jgi:hypothetical protein
MVSRHDVPEPVPAASTTPPARLRALQRLLAAEIDDSLPAHASAALATVVSGGRLGSPAAGAAVYRDSSRRARARSLELVYPVCRQVLGAGAFGGLAAACVAACPSRSPDLTELAAAFPPYLARWRLDPASSGPLGADLPYLPDLARLELTFHAALFAADDPPWDADAFAAAVENSGAGRLRLRLGRSVTVLASTFPVHEIWRRHREARDTTQVPAGNGDLLVVSRQALRPRVQRVSPDAFALLRAVADGQSLAALTERGYAVEQLGGLITDGLIVGFEVADR